MSFHFFWDALYNGVVDQNCIYADITKDIITFVFLSCHFIQFGIINSSHQNVQSQYFESHVDHDVESPQLM